MNIKIYVFLLFTFLSVNLFSQCTFSKRFNTSVNEIVNYSFELPNGNFLIETGKLNSNDSLFYPYFTTLDCNGNIVNEFLDSLNDMFGKIFVYGKNYIIANTVGDSLILSKYDMQFNLIYRKNVFFTNSIIASKIFCFIDQDSNIILSGSNVKSNPIPNHPIIYEGFVIKFDSILNEKHRNLSLHDEYNNKTMQVSNVLWDSHLNRLSAIIENYGPTKRVLFNDTLGIDSIISLSPVYGNNSAFGYCDGNQKFYIFAQKGSFYLNKDVILGIYNYQFDTLGLLYYSELTPNGYDSSNTPALNGGIAISGNNVYVAGTYNYNAISPSTGGGIPSWYFVGKIGNNNKFQWKKRFGGDSYYTLINITPTSDGGVLLSGFYYDFNSPTFQNDVYILKLDSNGNTTWTQNIAQAQVKLMLYPNPVSNQLNLQLISPNQSISSVYIFDIQGKEIINKQLNSKQLQLDVSSLSSGVYLIKGQTNTGLSFSRKFVKE
jgi:hypothetical protein